MTGIIWCIHHKSGINRLNKLIEDYNRLNILVERINLSKNNAYAHFSNGDIWKVIKINQAGRGQMCNISLVDNDINEKMLDYIIFPATKGLPYQAIGFYS